jgi:8-oxo-dGTP diphosphatase
MDLPEVKFCISCGTALERKEYVGKIRPVCPSCGWVYFPDPKVAVAVVIENEDQLLFVQRGVNPFKGLWTLPAGFLDAGEKPGEAACREVWEETGLKIEITELIGIISGQEYKKGAHLVIIYRAEIMGGKLKPGDDAARAEYFKLDELPPMAFQSTSEILRLSGY